MNIAILIPAYHPDEKLVELCKQLVSKYRVLVVDDGSGEEYQHIFDSCKELGITVLCHEVNKGKGRALKTGIRYFYEQNETGNKDLFTDGIITADSDGQHTFSDINKVAEKMQENPRDMILGVRDFSKMPFRSKMGNSITLFFFRLATGLKIKDTQTGLRGLPCHYFSELLNIKGERYEYEMNMILNVKNTDISIKQVQISTIYINNNKSSHFNTIKDGFKVFSRVLMYTATSMLCTVLDTGLFAVLHMKLPVEISYIFARIVSASVNYTINCRVIFKSKPTVFSVVGYIIVVISIMLIGSFLTGIFSEFIHPVVAKLAIDAVLFFINYQIQKRILFKKRS